MVYIEFMCNIESYKIDLKALPQGVTNLEFKLDKFACNTFQDMDYGKAQGRTRF